jgi:sorting nexin-25
MREFVKGNTDETHLMQYVGLFRQALWPGGNLKPPSIPRTLDEKSRTREDANRKLTTLMPGMLTVAIPLARSQFGKQISPPT